MRSRDFSSWMLGEALSMLDRAERLQRQFFTHVVDAWEPPVDVLETQTGLQVHIALPGVTPDSITIAVDRGGVSVSALRAFPCRESGSHLHRIEIPYGRFARRIVLPLEDPYMPIELVDKRLADGVLTLTFRKKESA